MTPVYDDYCDRKYKYYTPLNILFGTNKYFVKVT